MSPEGRNQPTAGLNLNKLIMESNILKIVEIVEKHLRKDHSFLSCIHIAQTLDMKINFDKLVSLDKNCPDLVGETLIHDYNGLKTEDEFFLPRLA
jgi:hypothetical protein